MTAMRTAEISGIFTRWLERYSPPAHMRDNSRAQQDEVTALLGVLLRFAPENGYMDFLAKVIDQIELQMKTRAWPTKGEICAVCIDVRKSLQQSQMDKTNSVNMTDVAIAARRMHRGEPIGENWLYGINACELIRRDLVDQNTLDSYRRGAFLERRASYGEAEALKWEAEAKARHMAAQASARGENGPAGFSGSVPDKQYVANVAAE